jgi:hypothetical protein
MHFATTILALALTLPVSGAWAARVKCNTFATVLTYEVPSVTPVGRTTALQSGAAPVGGAVFTTDLAQQALAVPVAATSAGVVMDAASIGSAVNGSAMGAACAGVAGAAGWSALAVEARTVAQANAGSAIDMAAAAVSSAIGSGALPQGAVAIGGATASPSLGGDTHAMVSAGQGSAVASDAPTASSAVPAAMTTQETLAYAVAVPGSAIAGDSPVVASAQRGTAIAGTSVSVHRAVDTAKLPSSAPFGLYDVLDFVGLSDMKPGWGSHFGTYMYEIKELIESGKLAEADELARKYAQEWNAYTRRDASRTRRTK